MGTELIMRRTDAGGGGERAEPPHGIVALFDAPVILLNMVVQVPTDAMMRVGAERLAYRMG